MNKQLRAAVIGVGVGKGHIQGYVNHPKADVAALCDINEELLSRIADEFGVTKGYTDYREMLEKEDLDIVSVALPNYLHKPVSIDALEAGCHVLCEKPMAMNAEEGRAMRDAARKNGRRLMINFNQRFGGASQAFKEQIEAGLLGDIYYGHTVWFRRMGIPGFGGWFGQKAKSGGGPLIDLGVHRLDLALWLMGCPKPIYVAASTYDHIAADLAKQQNKEFDVEDFATAFIKFENGATLILEASWAGHADLSGGTQWMELMGTKGGLSQRNGARFHFTNESGMYDMELAGRPGPDSNPREHFVNCILEEKQHSATAEEGITVMEILDAIYESARSGKPVLMNDG